uniref:PISTILLATA n=1 Tax=Bocconia frutescens TaxID=72182 RepID=A0A240EUQ7_9MAGN|nr:PISTILLATA [Bocconia frutescens]
MGRGKIEIKRIENSTNRQVTYSKRRNGIIKKAKEIAVLCDAKVSLVIFSSTGKMTNYCSPSSSLIEILDKYQNSSGKKLWDAKHEYLSAELDRIKKENDNMQIELRHLKGEDLTSLQPKELIPIEKALEDGYDSVRAKQERLLEEEQKRLTYICSLQQQQQIEINGVMREMGENGGGGGGIDNNHKGVAAAGGRDYPPSHHHYPYHRHHQMPFAFRVQPIQPNLHSSRAAAAATTTTICP